MKQAGKLYTELIAHLLIQDFNTDSKSRLTASDKQAHIIGRPIRTGHNNEAPRSPLNKPRIRRLPIGTNSTQARHARGNKGQQQAAPEEARFQNLDETLSHSGIIFTPEKEKKPEHC